MSQTNTSFETSFARLFNSHISHKLVIERIEIPLIQRDYAQGREGMTVKRIRDKFLSALGNAILQNGMTISLDFIYGDVVDGAFIPLDGQQRLTTLFLLHWYFAWRSNEPVSNQPWRTFAYATRPSARRFCERLIEFQPSAKEKNLSSWFRDQSWYLYPWQHDPTINSMLVMLDAIHERFYNLSYEDCATAWKRLVDPQIFAISFYLLPMLANKLNDELYIKMNSRGKLLTTFENFKANFLEALKKAHPEDKIHEFSLKIDTDWSDIIWCYRGSDNLIDDEFLRYFKFITDLCAWRVDNIPSKNEISLDELAEDVYINNKSYHTDNFEFLWNSFDTWHHKNIKTEFENLFSQSSIGSTTSLILFNSFDNVPKDESPIDLFAACCRLYEKPQWTYAHTLLLYAVLLSRIYKTSNFQRQIRILRNLIEASDNVIQRKNIHKLLLDVWSIIVDCKLQNVTTFNTGQVTHENDKENFLKQLPSLKSTLYRLEDNTLLRGCVSAFEINPSINQNTFIARANAFQELFNNPNHWKELTGALLAIGDYSRLHTSRGSGYRYHDFGVMEREISWRELFMGNTDQRLVNVLMKLLDKFIAVNNDISCLQDIQQSFLQKRATKEQFDWRYYFVKYPVMREGKLGRYAINPSGYGICMLKNPSMRGYYKDPYLLAICYASNVGNVFAEPWPFFYGYETKPRNMILKKSGIHIQCVDEGWLISEAPSVPGQKTAFDKVCAKNSIGQNLLLKVPQQNGIDTIDRVVIGTNLLKDFVNTGLA